MRGRWELAAGIVLCVALRASAQQMPHMHEQSAPAPKATSAPAAKSGLSLDALEGLALQRNPTLSQAAAQIDASRGKALQAGLWVNPVVGYIGDQMNGSKTAGELQGGYIQQVIVTAGKLRLSRAKYRQEAVEAELLAMAQQFRVANAVRLRYYEVLADQQILELRRQMAANAAESFKTYREMLNAGQAGKAETLMAEVDLGRARIAQRSIENRYLADWQGLVSVVGAPELPATHLTGSLESAGPPLDFESSLCRLLAESPQVQAARAHVVLDQIMVRRERVQPVPDVIIQADTGHNYESKVTVAGLQVGIPLPVFDRNQGTIQQARADLARSNAEVSRLELWLRQRLAEVFAQYQTARQTAELYREVNLPRAKEAYEVQQEMYRQRRLPWPRVVAMNRDLLTVRLEYVQSLLEERRAETQIVGFLLSDGLMEAQSPLSGGHIDSVPKPR